MVRRSHFGVVPIRFEDVVWFHQLTTQTRTNGIPTGKHYSIVVYARNGRKTIMQMPLARIAPALQTIHERAPWALAGYSDELRSQWKKRPAEVVAMSDKLRA
jgi:hypothetical protein